MKINGSRKQFIVFVAVFVAMLCLSMVPLGDALPCREPSGYLALQSSFITCHKQVQATIAIAVLLPLGMIFAICAAINRVIHIKEHATRSGKRSRGKRLR